MPTRAAKRGDVLAERAGEVYAFAAAGWVIRDMAAELGVSERTLYYSQRVRSDIAEAFDQGRAEYARRLAAKETAAIAAERQAAYQAAQQVTAMLGIVPAPATSPSPPPRSALPLDALQKPAGGSGVSAGGYEPLQPSRPPPATPDDDDPLAEALPLDDPLARW